MATKQPKLVDSNLFLGSGLEAKKLYRILQSSLSYIDSIKEFQATVFKGPSVFIPREIEQALCLNGKYIFYTKPNPSLVLEALSKVERTIRLKYHFKDNKPRDINLKFYIKSIWNPPANILLDFVFSSLRRNVQTRLNKLEKSLTSPKATFQAKSISNFLCGNRYLLKITDKNLGLAVITVDWYKEQIQVHLSNPKAYLVSNLDIDELIEKLQAILQSSTWPDWIALWLQSTTYELPSFYIIPKVHKSPWKSRPIIPSHSWITSRASEIVDYFLQKLLPKFPWVLDSTKTFINKLREETNCLQDTWLISGDVTSMYTNIPPKEAFLICSSLLKEVDLEDASLEAIISLLRFVLRNNYFSYQGTTYKQISGLAMGTSCAPIIANLYCASKEVDLARYCQSNNYFYSRYIDDIFSTFRGTKEALQTFLNKVQLGPLEITWTYSKVSMNFLDVQVYSLQGRLATTIYRKDLNKYLYIPFSSAHPIAAKKAFIKAERSRLRLICSEEEDYYNA